MSRASTLWRLQTLDQELDEKARRAALVDERLAGDPALGASRAALERATKQETELRASLRARELDAAGLDAKIRELEQRLYGGVVTNPKELEGLEKDVAIRKRQRSDVDTQLLELMEEIDRVQSHVREKTTALTKSEGTRSDDVARLAQERDKISERVKALTAERDAARAALDADAVRCYDRLRQTKGGRAVVQVRNGACGACGVSVPTGLFHRVQSGDDMILCSGCGRILVS